ASIRSSKLIDATYCAFPPLPGVEDRVQRRLPTPALAFAPRRCVTNLFGKSLRLLLLLACSPRQVIQCQPPECFGDARRAALTCKKCAPFGYRLSPSGAATTHLHRGF